MGRGKNSKKKKAAAAAPDMAAVSDGDGRDGGGEGGGAGRVRGEPPASSIAEPVGVRGRGLWRAHADVAFQFQPGRIHVRS